MSSRPQGSANSEVEVRPNPSVLSSTEEQAETSPKTIVGSTFYSILYERFETALKDESAVQAPSFFGDLNLDKIIEAITARWKDYNLTAFYHARLTDLDAISYRQEVMTDLESKPVIEAITSFTDEMRNMRVRLDQGKRLYYKWTIQRLFLEAVDVYCKAVIQM